MAVEYSLATQILASIIEKEKYKYVLGKLV